jgi:hypothetical protein
MDRINELEISLELLKAIHFKQLNVDSSMSILRKGMELVDKYPELTGEQRKTLLINVLMRVAKGEDGVFGSADDVLPEATVKQMCALLEGNMIENVIDIIVDATKGHFDINKTEVVVQQSCALIQLLIRCFKCNSKQPSVTVVKY